MKRHRWTLAGGVLSVLMVCQLAGCAPLAGKFVPEPTVAEGKALVYIYRPARAYDDGLKSYIVKADDQHVVAMYAGGYFPYFCSPGRVRFAARGEHTAALTVDIEAGQTYYLKLYLAEGMRIGTPALEMVSPETGIQELGKCRLIAEKKEAGFDNAQQN